MSDLHATFNSHAISVHMLERQPRQLDGRKETETTDKRSMGSDILFYFSKTTQQPELKIVGILNYKKNLVGPI